MTETREEKVKVDKYEKGELYIDGSAVGIEVAKVVQNYWTATKFNPIGKYLKIKVQIADAEESELEGKAIVTFAQEIKTQMAETKKADVVVDTDPPKGEEYVDHTKPKKEIVQSEKKESVASNETSYGAAKTVKLQGKDFVTHAGLLDKAHEMGKVEIETFAVTSVIDQVQQFKATVTIRGKDNEVISKATAYGDAAKENVNSMILKALPRMAETRAVNRALRFATNIGMTSSDELD